MVRSLAVSGLVGEIRASILRAEGMIIGAFYWAFLVFGGVVVLLAAVSVLAQVQDRPPDIASIVATVIFGALGAVIATYSARALHRANAGIVGARTGPGFSRDRMASSGCLFVILVVGLALLLSGPMLLFQLPGMAPQDRPAFGLGAAVSIVLGASLATPGGLLLWRRRSLGPGAAASRLLVGVVVGLLTVLVGGALLLASIFDPRFDMGPAGRLAIGAVMGVGVIGTAAFGVGLWRRLV